MTVQKNVVVIGPCGMGKSSLVNMFCPAANIPVSVDAERCTKNQGWYPCEDLKCQVHDTLGLTEEAGKSLLAKFFFWKNQTSWEVKKVKEYLKHVKDKEGGIHLLIYCVSGQRCKKISMHKKNYKRFKDVVGNVVPVVVVVTGLDFCREDRENWWTKHGGEIFGMDSSVGYACITALPPDPNNPGTTSNNQQNDFYEDSCVVVKDLVIQYMK